MSPSRKTHSSSDALAAPIFLVGSERSGTTLLRLMLDHHPEIAFEHEFDLAVTMVSDDGRLPDVGAYREWLPTVRGFSYAVDPGLDYRALVTDFLRQKVSASGDKRYVGATVHHDFERLVHVWPKARFIHLVRDPHDVARSVVQQGWAGNVYHAAEWWLAAERSWDTLRQELAPDRAIDVRYEELVAHPEEHLTRLCAFIGVAYDAAMLEYGRSARQYPKPDPTLAFQWRHKMSLREALWIEQRIGDRIEQRGYERSTATRPIGRLTHASRMLDSKLSRLRFRAQRFGVDVVVLDMIGRRARLPWLVEHARRRIHAIQLDLIDREAKGERAPSANMTPQRFSSPD